VERKDCFGSIREIVLKDGLTKTNAKPECRNCEQVRDCMRYGKQLAEERKEREELRKQTMIAQIIDISVVLSNEIGTCLLEFLNRIYNSSLGTVLFRNLLLFYEIPKSFFSMPLTIPISQETLRLIQGESEGSGPLNRTTGVHPTEASREKFFIRIILIQRSFQNNRKANIGLIAHEVARVFSTDDYGIRQIRETLNDSEKNLFKKMDERQRMPWLLTKWGFLEELEALKQEIPSLEAKKLDLN
jgi:hypothetical protein